ncbi:MAG: chitobiase/beta-hexosaminidase C-terminal domain-containing protein [Candidatus Paceibacterota bacterium]|jgi:hypothetical protein
MLRFNSLQKKIVKISQFLLVFTIIFSWIFSGWPQLFNFPPKAQEAQALTNPQYASSYSVDGTLGEWSNQTYVYSDDGTNFATRVGTVKNTWYGDLFGFDLSGIPDNSTINSVTITAEWKNSGNDTSGPVLYLGAQSGGAEVGTATSDTSGQNTFEVVTKVPTGLTTADLKATGANGFWAILRFRRTDNTAHTASVDYVKVVVDYTPPAVDTPTFTDSTGTYNNDLSETITVASPASAVICYTTDGSTPAANTPGTCSTGTTYSGAVPITATGTTLKAIGTKAGYTNSAVQSATYTLQVANPSFGTNGGSFNNDTTSTQTSTTTSAVFCQTVDGTTTPAANTPGTCSTGTTGADATVIATGKTIKVLGTKANYVNSAVQTSNAFTLTVGAITSSPGAGNYNSTQSVTLNITTTTGAVAHYTTNGDAVTCSSTTYSGAFDVAVTTTVKAIGCKTNYVSDTAISDLYTISLSTAIEIRAQNYTTSVSTITFPPGASGATVSQPYNNVNGSGSPQTFGGAGTAKPVVTLYNGGGSTLTIWYNVTTFTNGVVSNEYYLVNNKGAACSSASCITQSATFDTDTTTGTTITAGAGNEKDFYLKTILGTPAGKSGTSTLTILGEGL